MSNASSDPRQRPLINVGEQAWPVRLVPHARAKRYRLVFDAAKSELRLTLPRRASAAGALRWASEQQEWLTQQVGKAAKPIIVGPGVRLPLFGVERDIVWDPALSRTVRVEPDALLLGGPADTVGRRLERWVKAQALDVMTRESHDIAARAGLRVGRVGVGDPASRWGSCTALGDLRYSWRLILAPEEVRRATVAHEVAHLRHMDHSAAFHALVDQLHDGDVAQARGWLRREGRGLHSYRFGQS